MADFIRACKALLQPSVPGSGTPDGFFRPIAVLHGLLMLGVSALREYSTHYLQERNHQGVNNQLLEPANVIALSTGPVQRRERVGGMLSYYHREAA